MPARDVFSKNHAFPMIPMMGSLGLHAAFLLFIAFFIPSQSNVSSHVSPRGFTSLEEATEVIFSVPGRSGNSGSSEKLEGPRKNVEQKRNLTSSRRLKNVQNHGTISAEKEPRNNDAPLPSKASEGVPSNTGSAHTQSDPNGSGVANGDPNAGPLERYLFGLRQVIESKKVYPSLSRRMGETGKALVVLKLLRDGTVQDVRLKGSSRYARLDQVALDAVAAVEKYKPIPDSIAENELTVEVPIEFKL